MDKTKIYAEEMTLRDYFAGQALAGILTIGEYCATLVAESAYKISDAMMKERDK